MKQTYTYEVETHKAFSRKMACPVCNSNYYDIYHQLSPESPEGWWVQCHDCKIEGLPGPTKDIAIGRWKQL